VRPRSGNGPVTADLVTTDVRAASWGRTSDGRSQSQEWVNNPKMKVRRRGR
jgi:hypothetical protein